jgi:hypothetical protein
MAALKDLVAPQGVMVDKDGAPLPPLYRWITLAGNVLLAITSSGATASRPTKFLWVGRNYWNTDTTVMEWWSGSAWITWGGGGGGAPTNATYVTMSLDATLTNERVLAVGSPITLVDGGAGGNATIDFDETVTLGNNARVAVNKNSGATVGTRRRLNFIEGANVTLTIADDAGNEEVDVTIAASGGGGGGTSGTANLDFGGSPTAETDVTSVTVADAGVGVASEIIVSLQYAATADHTADEVLITPINLCVGNISAGVGFDILGYCSDQAWGKFPVAWVRN